MQAGEFAGEHDESGGGDFGGGGEVHCVQRFAQGGVVFGGEGEFGRGSPFAEFLVVVLAFAVGDIVVQQVGNFQGEVAGVGVGLALFFLQLLELGVDFFGFGFEGVGGVGVAVFHGVADLARLGVAGGAQFFGFGQQFQPPRLQFARAGGVQDMPAPRQIGGGNLRRIPQQFRIQHQRVRGRVCMGGNYSAFAVDSRQRTEIRRWSGVEPPTGTVHPR